MILELQNRCIFVIAIILLVIFLTRSTVASECLDNPVLIPFYAKPIVIDVETWNSSALGAYIFKILLEECIGIPTSFNIVNSSWDESHWSDLAVGNTHLNLELWEQGYGDDTITYEKQYMTINRLVISTGALGIIGGTGWYTQYFVLEDYPHIDFQSLADPTIANYFNNTFYQGDITWAPDSDIISSYNLSFVVIALGGEGPLVDQIIEYTAKKKPMLFYFWEPHALFDIIQMVEITLPSDIEYIGGTYGQNILGKVAYAELPQYSPPTYYLATSYSLKTKSVVQMLRRLLDGETLENVACWWVRNNTNEWKYWITPLVNPVNYISWDNSLGIVCVFFACTNIIITGSILICMLIKRKHPLIVAGGLRLMVLILVGALLLCLSTFFLIGYATKDTCNSFVFLFGMGFSMMWGTVILKEYRIYFIYHKGILAGSNRISIHKLIAVIVPIVMLEIIICAVWVSVEPMEFRYGFCSSFGMVSHLYLIYKAILLIIAFFMGILTRGMSTVHAESHRMAIGISSFAVLAVLIVILSFYFLPVVGIIFTVVIGVNIALISFVAPVFVWRVYKSIVQPENEATVEIAQKVAKPSGISVYINSKIPDSPH